MNDDMSDRELLELAAKAYFGPGNFEWNGVNQRIEYIPDGSVYYRHWEPRDHDGDAMRLCVKLHIDPHWSHLGYATALHVPLEAGETIRVTVPGNDPYAATRLAIFMAAVEIGKAMP